MTKKYQLGERLSEEDAAFANNLLDRIRKELAEQSNDDPIRLHLLRRRIVKYLGYDEKSTPMERKALKKRKMAEQGGLCTLCSKPLPANGYYAVLDRKIAHLGYTDENVNLIHNECDHKAQAAKGYK